MHFTFIALTPVINVDFLSYQYKIFTCKLSDNGKEGLMALGEGRALLADQAQQTPERCSSSEEECSELVGSGPVPL